MGVDGGGVGIMHSSVGTWSGGQVALFRKVSTTVNLQNNSGNSFECKGTCVLYIGKMNRNRI